MPNGFAFGPDGALIGSKVPRFDIRESESREMVEEWLAPGRSERPGTVELPAEPTPAALDLFAEGSRLMRDGRRGEALAAWAQAHDLDPKDLIIRKQIWRALYPERFGDPIDFAWQKEQMAREDERGFQAANPGLSKPRPG